MIANPVWGVSILLTNDPGVKDLDGFAGKTIMVPFAKSPLDLQLNAILRKSGMTDKVRVDFAPVQQQIPMLLTKKTDGICVPEPLASKLLYEKKAFYVFSFAKKWAELNNDEPRTPQVSLFVKKDFAEKNRLLLNALNKEMVKKIDIIAKSKDAISNKYASVFSIDEQVLRMSLDNVIFEIPDYRMTKTLCTDYETAIGDEEKIDDKFFFK